MFPAETQPVPVRLGAENDFRAVRQFLRDADYTAELLCRSLGEDTLPACMTASAVRRRADPFLVRLLFCGNFVERSELERHIPPDVAAAFQALGLLASEDERSCCPAMLYPAGSLFLASDRIVDPLGNAAEVGREFVYPGITENSTTYVGMLPRTPCEALLDLGTGSGVAALLLAAEARQVWATDLSGRCVAFAEFNRRLNGVANVTVLKSDGFHQLAGMTFDRIVSHPPYDPLERSFAYCDGGEGGELITQRIIRDLPAHLRPGGRFYCLTMCADRHGEPAEARIRGWLGVSEREFDVALVARSVGSPAEFAAVRMLKSRGDTRLIDQAVDRMEALGIEQLVYTSLAIQRHGGARPPVTVRRRIGPSFGAAELDWLLDWEAAAPAFDPMRARLAVSEAAELRIVYRVEDERLAMARCDFRCSQPFSGELSGPPWLAALVSRCGRPAHGADIYEFLHETAGVSRDRFDAAVRQLIS
ncbi:MAG: methyltransferase, partial [Acidobacteria bacterium]|nr:methyltransferase [Acidobacteriota bacterium]